MEIFISYAREDFDIAEKLNNDLRNKGVRTWFDKEVLLPRAFASVDIVEREGSGIPTTIRECIASNAPEPIVVQQDGFVIVKLSPSEDWKNIDATKAQREILKRREKIISGKKIMVMYSHKDEKWKDRLTTHFGVLEKQGLYTLWDDRKIEVGDDWFPEIENNLNESCVVVMIISADFLTSNFIRKQVSRILENRQKQELQIFPLIVKPCVWKKIEWLKKMQVRPKDGKALSGCTEYEIDKNLSELAIEVEEILRKDHKGNTNANMA